MGKVYGYLRVSGKGQENGQGFDRQRDTIARFCRKAGYKVERYFEDVHTGTVDGVDRPGFADLVRTIDADGSRVVVVERLDRLARTVVAQEHTVLWLAAHDIELIVADTGENVSEAYRSDPMKKALIQMQAVFAELDKSMIVKKLRTARDRVRKTRGKCEGAKAYGEVDPNEKKTIKRIKELRRRKKGIKRMGSRKIAKILNADGIPTRQGKGKEWKPQTVANIIDRLEKGSRKS